MTGSRYRVSVDIGGTFTDLVIHHHATGERRALKVLTTHDDPRRGVMTGVATLLDQAAHAGEVGHVGQRAQAPFHQPEGECAHGHHHRRPPKG